MKPHTLHQRLSALILCSCLLLGLLTGAGVRYAVSSYRLPLYSKSIEPKIAKGPKARCAPSGVWLRRSYSAGAMDAESKVRV